MTGARPPKPGLPVIRNSSRRASKAEAGGKYGGRRNQTDTATEDRDGPQGHRGNEPRRGQSRRLRQRGGHAGLADGRDQGARRGGRGAEEDSDDVRGISTAATRDPG